MQIILLDKVVNLGNLGEVVKVKDGYARNFLIPSGRARRATLASRRVYRQGGSACLDASQTNQFILNVASLYDTGLK